MDTALIVGIALAYLVVIPFAIGFALPSTIASTTLWAGFVAVMALSQADASGLEGAWPWLSS